MAVDKNKVKARIKALFPKTNLTQSRLDEISAKLAEKPADDADDAAIDQVIADFNENSLMSIEDIAKNDDRIRTLARKAAEPENKTPKKVDSEDKTDDSKNDDPLSVLLNGFKSLQQEFADLKAKDQQKTIEDRFKADERLKDIPAAFLKGRVPKDEESFDSTIEELVTDWSEISGHVSAGSEKKKLSNFGKDVPPAGNGGKGNAKQVSTEVTDAMAKRLL